MRGEVFEDAGAWGWAVLDGTLVVSSGHAADPATALVILGPALLGAIAERVPFPGNEEITAEHPSVDLPTVAELEDPWSGG